jgi:hypothetical protein
MQRFGEADVGREIARFGPGRDLSEQARKLKLTKSASHCDGKK